MKHKNLFNIIIAVFILVGFYVAPVSADSDNQSKQRWTYQDVFESGVTPFAIGHRGYGVKKNACIISPVCANYCKSPVHLVTRLIQHAPAVLLISK